MAKSYTKAALIAEISETNKMSKRSVARILEQLSQIAYREARDGFVIPGIGKLKVVNRKARKCRNPVTGQLLQIGERDVLKMVPLKKAKDAITPRASNLITVLDTPPETKTTPIPPSESAPAASPPASSPSFVGGDEEGQIVFNCPECGGVIGAPTCDAGLAAACPFCKVEIRVPTREEAAEDKASLAEQESGKGQGIGDFITFVCTTCNQEIEAPVDIIGMEATCPSCGSLLNVPDFTAGQPEDVETAEMADVEDETDEAPRVDPSSVTLRLDLSDLD